MTKRLLVWTMAAAFAAPAMQRPDAAALALESARKKENVSGDLEGAIRQYKEVAAKYAGRPAIVAQALVALGQCYEKLGSAEARKAYERVVKEFGGEAQAAGVARARLSAMGGGKAEPRPRMLAENRELEWGRVSADGRYLSVLDWTTGDVAVRDQVTGVVRRVTNKGGFNVAMAEAEAAVVSPHGERIAFGWFRWDKDARRDGPCELRVIGMDGQGERVLLGGKEYIEPHSWSPDGKWIAVAAQTKGTRDTEVLLVAVEDGTVRKLPVRRTLYKSDLTFSPDGQWLAYSSASLEGSGSPMLYTLRADGSAAAESEVAADAQLVGWAPDGKGLVYTRKVEGSQRLFLLPMLQGKPAGDARMLATAGGARITTAGITTAGTLVFKTHDVDTRAWISEFDARTGRLGARQADFPVWRIGPALASSAVKISPDGKEYFAGVSLGAITIGSLATGAKRTLMPQLARLSRVDWAADGRSLRIVGRGNDGQEGLYQVDLLTGAATLLTAVPAKMIWAVDVSSPDDFYYIDDRHRIVRRKISSGQETILVDDTQRLANGGAQIQFSHDRTKLGIRSGGYLGILDLATGNLQDVLTANADSNESIWGFDWSGDDRSLVTIWRQGWQGRTSLIRSYPVEGGTPVESSAPVELRGLSLSSDGKRLASMSYSNHSALFALGNFLPSAAK